MEESRLIMIDKYYEEELRYLYESGKEFAKAYPDRAQFLNLDSVGDRDPYVERLFEGFAFVAARIREKLDDSFPEITEGFFNLIWPELMQEIPSLTIIEFKPRRGLLQETQIIKRGAELLSGSVGQEGAICRFTTASDVRVSPILLSNIQKTVDTKGKATLTLRFELEQGIQLSKLSLSPLRIYFHAEMPTALMLHEFFIRRANSIKITVGEDVFSCNIDPKKAILPCGFLEDECLLPKVSGVFRRYLLLLEYFVYPEKFLFVDLYGFENIPFIEKSPRFIEYKITFDNDFPADKPFSKENIRLFCCPAVNIFRKDAEPIFVNGLETEYRVTADANYPQSFKIHSIISVKGTERATGKTNEYEPLYSFKMAGKKRIRTYAVHYRYSPKGNRDVYLSLGGERIIQNNNSKEIIEENLSIEAWCTNGMLPRDEIREGGIVNPGPNFPVFVSFTNITRPTLPFFPPKNEDFLWLCISHLGFTYYTLASADTLKTLLHIYDWSNSEGKSRRIEAITEVSAKNVERIVKGSVLRGVEFKITLNESEFFDISDIHLFGMVLKEFLTQYVSINTFLNLIIVTKPSGAVLQWIFSEGKKWTI
jgi:type VI secretion system protein ImpG